MKGEGGGGGDRSYLDSSTERDQQKGRYIHQQHRSFGGNNQPQHLQPSLPFLSHDSSISTAAGVVHDVSGETSALAAGSHLDSTGVAPTIHHSSDDHIAGLGGTVAGQSDSTPPPNVSSSDTTPSSDTNSPPVIGVSPSEGGNVSPASLSSSRQSVGTIGSSRDRGQPRSPLSGFPTVPEESPHPEADAHVQQPPLEGVAPGTAAHSVQSNTLAIKLLVSNNMAGSIIGRMGQTISDLQSRSSSRIKLSQSGDYYPGTNDRVCLVQGQVESVRVAMKLILHQLYELHRQQQQQQCLQPSTDASGVPLAGGEGIDAAASSGSDVVGPRSTTTSSATTSSPFIVRILVPTNCCGMLIGKGGSNIKSIAELSGVSTIRLSAKENEGGYPATAVGMGPTFPASTGERILTIIGHSLQSCVACSSSVLDCMALHPEISRYTNLTTSYAGRPAAQQLVVTAIGRPGVTGGGSMVPRLGSMPGQDSNRLSWHFPSHAGAEDSSQHQDQLLLMPQHGGAGTGGIHQGSKEGAVGSTSTHRLVQPQQQQPPRTDGEAGGSDEGGPSQAPAQGFSSATYTSQQESQQFYVLATQGSQPVLYAPTGVSSDRRPEYGPSFGNRSSEAASAVSDQFSAMNLGSSGTDSSTTMPSGQEQPDEQFQQSYPPSDGSHQVFGHHLSHPYRQQQHHLQRKRGHGAANVQISVPDALVGAILGRGGQTLSELEASSKTRIKISQRGVFEPGTTNRIVTITGKDAASVESAQYFISQRLAQSVVRPIGLAPSATSTDYRQSQGQSMAAPHSQEAQQHLTSQQLRVQHSMQMHHQQHVQGQHPQLHGSHHYHTAAFHQQSLESARSKPSAGSSSHQHQEQEVQSVSSPLRYLRQSSSQERLPHSQPQQQIDQTPVMQFPHVGTASSPFMPSTQGGELSRSSSHEHLRQQQQQQPPAAHGGGGAASSADQKQTRLHADYNPGPPMGNR